MFVKVFGPFLIRFHVFILLNFKSSLYIVYDKLLSMCLLKIFSASYAFSSNSIFIVFAKRTFSFLSFSFSIISIMYIYLWTAVPLKMLTLRKLAYGRPGVLRFMGSQRVGHD